MLETLHIRICENDRNCNCLVKLLISFLVELKGLYAYRLYLDKVAVLVQLRLASFSCLPLHSS